MIKEKLSIFCLIILLIIFRKKAVILSDSKTGFDFDGHLTIGGYSFISEKAAQTAKDELNAIKYVSSKTDAKDPKQVYKLYNTILDKELFHSPIGLEYLRQLQTFLYDCKEIPQDKIRPIPVNFEMQNLRHDRSEISKSRGEIQVLKKKSQQYKDKMIKLLIVNFALIIVIAVLFLLIKSGTNPTIIDYENKIQNKYAAWQEQLEAKEAALKEREQQLQKR